MPELPEVEVVKRELSQLTIEKPRIERIEFMRKDLRDPMPIRKIQTYVGARILSIQRRAKYLLIETEKGGLLSHLGMTGTWRVAPLGSELLHDHIYLYLSTGVRLAFRDPRRFGIFETCDFQQLQKNPRLKFLGPEPLQSEFTALYLRTQLRGKKTAIKTALMNQKIVVGIGNIYASEALFRSKIRPTKPADKMSLAATEVLVEKIQEVLGQAIQGGGSSISDFKGTSGKSGYFHLSHQVYDRKGEKCVVCGTPIKAVVLAGRSTFWCPSCQT